MAQEKNSSSQANLEAKADKGPAQAALIADPRPEQTTAPAEADKNAPAQE